MRIGLIGPLPPPAGGIANQTRQLATLLAGEGAHVEVVQTNPPYWPRWIGRLRGARAAFRLVPYLGALWRCAGRTDVFHVMASSGWAWYLHAAPAIRIGRLRGVPVVVNYRGGGAEAFLQRSAPRVKRVLDMASALIVPSCFLAGVFTRFGIETEIVPNVVDLSRFHPDRARLPGHRLIVTRSLEEIYDIPTALRAFVKIRAAFPDAALAIAGSGSSGSELARLAETLGLGSSVSFTGPLDGERLAELYRSADLLLNPSTVDNTPNSLLEALAAEVPIVSTNVGGVPFLVEDGTQALLVPPRDPDTMARAAIRVLGDRSLAQRLTRAGRSHVQNFGWREVWPVLSRLYTRALAERPMASWAR